jgi:hypothetical protein
MINLFNNIQMLLLDRKKNYDYFYILTSIFTILIIIILLNNLEETNQ